MTAQPASAASPGRRSLRRTTNRQADADPTEPLMTIGEVLAHLRAEFPDTTVSKLRFLEAEGLVEPRRTPSGYRKYSWADVARLRFILTAQRDQYLPLRVIREQLARHPDWPLRPPLAPVQPPHPGLAEVVDGEVPQRLTRAELAARAGVDEAAIVELEQHGLLAARPGGWYDAEALTVAVIAAQLARHGVQARHLRACRGAADREVGLLRQVVAPLLHSGEPGARERAAETIRELTGLSQRLHAALVRAGLRELLG